jgi:hypothetical protein
VSDAWMNHVRWSYLHRIRLMALQQGLTLVKVPGDDPDAELEGYLAGEWGDEEEDPTLFTLLEQATGDKCFPEGATIGQIEDYLTSGPHATANDTRLPAED